MAVKMRARHEARTRVIFNLPLNDAGEENAFYEITTYLQRLKDRAIGVTGFTFSTPIPAVFTGFWWSDEENVWIDDAIVIVMVDFATPPSGAKWTIGGEMTKLKRFISAAYRRHGSQQEEVWIVAHQVTRQM